MEIEGSASSAADGAGAGGEGEGVDSATSGLPQRGQKRAPGLAVAPQAGQTAPDGGEEACGAIAASRG